MIRKSFFNLHEYFTEDEIDFVVYYIENTLLPKINENRTMGVMEDSVDGSSTDLNLKYVSHIITKVDIKGSYVNCEYELLNTPCGDQAKALIDEKVILLIKPRAIKLNNGRIINLFFDLAIGDKKDYREQQIQDLLGE